MPATAALLCLVIGVTDGDTLTVRCPPPDERVKVRIAAIDAPERGRPYSRLSRQSLVQLCHGQQAFVQARDVDRYDSIVADVRCQGKDAAQHQVASGMARVYDRYAQEGYSYLYPQQDKAQSQRLGIWKKPSAPWRRKRTPASGTPASNAVAPPNKMRNELPKLNL